MIERLCAPAMVAVLLGALAAPSLRAGDAAQELEQLDRRFYAGPDAVGEKQVYPTFQPLYAELAARYPGTEQATTARLRLLELTVFLDGDAGKRAAESAVDRMLAESPHSEQLQWILDRWYRFDQKKLAQYLERLSDPAQPDCVRASVTLQYAISWCDADKREKAKPYLDELLGKYRDVPHGLTTYGAIADALASPHPASALAYVQPAPEIAGRDAFGHAIRLSSLKGKVVVIDFFGDW